MIYCIPKPGLGNKEFKLYMSENLKKYNAVVSLFRNTESENDYYVRYDASPEKANEMLSKLNGQHGYSVETALQIPFTFEPNESFYNPAKQEAELFIDFLKNEIASDSKEESFIGGWYEIKKLDKDTWLKDFAGWKEKREKEMMVMESSPQQSLF